MRAYLLTEKEIELIEAYMSGDPIPKENQKHLLMLKLRVKRMTDLDADALVNQVHLLVGFKLHTQMEKIKEMEEKENFEQN